MYRLDLICELDNVHSFFDSFDTKMAETFPPRVVCFNAWLKELEENLEEFLDSSGAVGTIADKGEWYHGALRNVLTREFSKAFESGIPVCKEDRVLIGDKVKSIALPGTTIWFRPVGGGATLQIEFVSEADGVPYGGEWNFFVQLWADLLEDRCDVPVGLGAVDALAQMQPQPLPEPPVQPFPGNEFRGLVVRVRGGRSPRGLFDLRPTFTVDTSAVLGLQLSVLMNPGETWHDLWLFRSDPSSMPIGQIDPQTLRMQIDSTIDPPLVIEASWLVDPVTAPGLVMLPPVFDVTLRLPRLQAIASFLVWRRVFSTFAHTPEMLLARRRYLIRLGDGRLRIAREFFTDLDEMTMISVGTSAAAPEAWKESEDDRFDDLTRRLTYDWWGRASQLLDGATSNRHHGDPSSDGALSTPESDLCRMGGRGFLTLLSRRFPGPTGLDFELIETAFVQFASGQLSLETTFEPALQGELEPDGVLMFCFMELSCQMRSIEKGEEAETWSRLMRIFGLASEVFVRTYHTLGGHRRVCAYVPPNNDRGKRRPTEEDLVAMRASWTRGNLKPRFGRLVLSALWQDFQNAPPRRMIDIPDILPDSIV